MHEPRDSRALRRGGGGGGPVDFGTGDQSGESGQGLTTVPMMTGGSADHALAVELHLRPVLVEIGASCPTRGLFVFGPAVDDPAPTIDAWWDVAGPVLARS